MLSNYKSSFYKRVDLNYESALLILKYIFDLVNVKSIIDLGCGTGIWLKAAKELGVLEIVGVDFHNNYNMLVFPKENYIKKNLIDNFYIDKKFDLAICLEVAEHLPENNTNDLIRKLVGLSDLILFSAAIPFQGGTNHINEKWQSFWVWKFEEYGFKKIDIIRKNFWDNPSVRWWYSQNAFIFVNMKNITKYENLIKNATDLPLDIVHPKNYISKISKKGLLKRVINKIILNI